MIYNLRKIAQIIFINGLLLVALIITIQNSDYKSKVDFLILETIELPISFIVGVSFISGSILGNFLPIQIVTKK